MNAGLSNLATLKAHLLAAPVRNDGTLGSAFDSVLLDIGKGVSAQMEKFCQRKFLRVVNQLEVFPADRSEFVMMLAPVEIVWFAALKLSEADGFITQTADFIHVVDYNAGIVFTDPARDAGPSYAQVRFTYTGGYWWEQLEPGDGGYPSTQPSGSAALPDDLKLAWLIQCQHIWDSVDRLGQGIADKPKAYSAINSLDLAPQVREMLRGYVRYRMV